MNIFWWPKRSTDITWNRYHFIKILGTIGKPSRWRHRSLMESFCLLSTGSWHASVAQAWCGEVTGWPGQLHSFSWWVDSRRQSSVRTGFQLSWQELPSHPTDGEWEGWGKMGYIKVIWCSHICLQLQKSRHLEIRPSIESHIYGESHSEVSLSALWTVLLSSITTWK